MTRVKKFDIFKETINKLKVIWLKDIENVDWELQHEWLKSFREEIVLLLYDCENDDDKEFLYKYIEFINQTIDKVLEDQKKSAGNRTFYFTDERRSNPQNVVKGGFGDIIT